MGTCSCVNLHNNVYSDTSVCPYTVKQRDSSFHQNLVSLGGKKKVQLKAALASGTL